MPFQNAGKPFVHQVSSERRDLMSIVNILVQGKHRPEPARGFFIALRPNETDDLFIAYDRNHPSAAGHRIIGQTIFEYLEQHHAAILRNPAAEPVVLSWAK